MRQRPLAWIGGWTLFALAAAVFCSADLCRLVSLVLLAVGLLFCVSFSFLREKSWAVLFFLLAAVFLYASFPKGRMEEICSRLDGQDVYVRAVVTEEPAQNRNGSFVYQLNSCILYGVEDGEEIEYPYPLRMTTPLALPIEDGDSFEGMIHLHQPEGEGYSAKSYYQSRNMPLLCWMYRQEAYTVTQGEEETFSLSSLRRWVHREIRAVLPDSYAQICQAVALGEKEGLSEETEVDFRRAGASAVLVVSGMHLSILIQIFLCLFRRAHRFVRGGVCILVVLVFALFTGFGFSVQRSVIMQVFYLVGTMLFRRSDGLNSLGGAALGICLFHPLAAGDTGLLLSFAATAGILFLQPHLQRFLQNRWKRKEERWPVLCRWQFIHRGCRALTGALSVSLSSFLFTLPVLVLTFGEFSAWGVFSNLLLQIPCALVLVFTLLGACLSFLGLSGSFCYLIAGWMARGMRQIAAFFSAIPGAGITVDPHTAQFWCGMVCLLCAAGYFFGWRRRTLLLSVMGSVALLIFLAVLPPLTWADREVVSIHVRGGDSAVTVSCGLQGETLFSSGFCRQEITSFREQDGCWSSWEISPVCWRSPSACYLNRGSYTILLCTQQGDAGAIPQEYRNPDVLILLDVPEHVGLLDSRYTITPSDIQQDVPGEYRISLEYEEDFSLSLTESGEWDFRRK